MVGKSCFSENADVFPGIIARNVAVLEYEKFIHRRFYPYIIHPYSRFRVNWEKAFLIIIFLRLNTVSLIWVILPHQSKQYQTIMLLFRVINFLDVVVNFFTGYIESKTETAVLDPKKIARKYVLGYFIFDFVPSIPMEIFLILLFDENCIKTSAVFKLTSEYRDCEAIIDFSIVCVLLRLFTFFRYLNNLGKIMLWDQFLLGITCVACTVYTALLFANDFYTMVYLKPPPHHVNRMLGKLKAIKIKKLPEAEITLIEKVFKYFSALTALMLDCLYYDTTTVISNPYVRSLMLVVAFFCGIVFMAYFIKYVMVKMTAREAFLSIESRVLSFVKKRHLSPSLCQKTLLYFQILLENKYWREDEVFNYIPDTFRAEIFFHLCLPLLKNFYPFEDLPKYVLRRLAECMKYQMYLPNEVILQKDNITLSLYFIQRGTAALYSANHVELYHFEAGSYFNGRNFIMGEVLTTTYAISIEVTEVYRLEHNDFLEIMTPYPKLLKAVQNKFLQDKSRGTCLLD